jgi:5,10-methylenetetrahydromethanopterin reductase
VIKSGLLVNQIPGVPVTAVVELCQEAERLGYGRCWVADQGLDTRDVYVTLTAIAQKTDTIRLGPGITNPYTRHPMIAAASIASLDELARGRAFHGIGAGGLDTLHPLGMDHRKPVTAVREMIQTTRALYHGEAVSFHGEILHLQGAHLDYARPSLEIWVAGRGKRMLALAGELADGVMLGFIHKETLQDYVDLIGSGAARSGNKPKLCYYAMMITDEPMLEQVRPYMFYLLADSPPNVKERLGITAAQLEAIHQVMVRDGLAEAGKLIKEEWIRPFALMGSVADCAAELTQLMTRYQLDEFVLPILDLATAHDLLARVATALPAAEARSA